LVRVERLLQKWDVRMTFSERVTISGDESEGHTHVSQYLGDLNAVLFLINAN